MTFRFFDAEITVGEKVGASSASMSTAATGDSAAMRSTAWAADVTSPSTVWRNPSTSGPSCGSGR